MYLARRILFLLLLITALDLCAAAQAQPSPSPHWRTTPATPSGVNQRIEDAAIENQERAPVPRTVLYDISYPANDEEFTALDGHAVILLAALSQRREELPLQKVFILTEDGSEIPLKQIRLVLSEQVAADSLTAGVLGRYRGDALYLLPVYLRLRPVELHAEFAGKDRYRVAKFGTNVTANVLRLKISPPTGNGPNESVLNVYIRREFPGF